jgi:hypothetical protein
VTVPARLLRPGAGPGLVGVPVTVARGVTVLGLRLRCSAPSLSWMTRTLAAAAAQLMPARRRCAGDASRVSLPPDAGPAAGPHAHYPPALARAT